MKYQVDNALFETLSGRSSFRERVCDIFGWLPESITEAEEQDLKALAGAVIARDEAEIGRIVLRMVEDYCLPGSEDEEEERWG